MLRAVRRALASAIFDAYEEAAPLADGLAGARRALPAAPLLVHAVLFGGSYGAAAERVRRARYAG